MTEEQYLIAQIFWQPSLINKLALESDDFQDEDCKTVFMAMNDVEVIDELSIAKKTGFSLSKILNMKPDNIITSTWEHYQNVVIDESRKKRIRMVAEKMLSTDLDADSMIDLFSEATKAVRSKATYKIESLSDCVMETISDIERRATQKGLDGLSTGFRKLDSMIGGLQKGRLYYIAARPSQGKSTLLMNMAVNQKVPTIFVSAESNKKELTKRMISYKGNIINSHINNGTLTEDETGKLSSVSSELFDKRYFKIYDESNLSLGRLINICHEAKKYHNVEAIFVDYIQIINHPNNRLAKHEQVADISKTLKQIARDLNIPVICASQLRRDAEGKKPQLSDFSDSTQLERDADVGIAIYNIPDKDGNLNIGKNTYICILKNRDGGLGDIKVDGQMEYYRFQEALDTTTKQIAEQQETRIYF